MRAFGALTDKDIIMSHKHQAIALRYASETHARAAFRACQERASNWFNIAKVSSWETGLISMFCHGYLFCQ